ncbi:hypothetical protein PMAC_002800 [Pneumocystis sp. 'macacae']|nr:hypothetical protein PMAC_002800 [Pneumocystis sp. 'macacae']
MTLKSIPEYYEGIKKNLEKEACLEEFKEECNNLSLCKEEKRDNLKMESFLREFAGNLKTEDCKKAINEKCLIFMEESDELMEF